MRDMERWVDDAILGPLLPSLVPWGIRVFGVFALLWTATHVGAWLKARLVHRLRGWRLDEASAALLGGLVRWTVILSAGLMCLGLFGIDSTGVAALLGAAALAVGLALQGTLTSLSAGISLLVFRPFRVGDQVEVAGQRGVVAEIGLFTTCLDTGDNRRVTLPNHKVNGAVIQNHTHHALRRVDVGVGVSYAADVDRVRQVLEAAASVIPGRHPQRGHQVFLVRLGSAAVEWEVRVWAATEDYFDVHEATVRAVKRALDSQGITVPSPLGEPLYVPPREAGTRRAPAGVS